MDSKILYVFQQIAIMTLTEDLPLHGIVRNTAHPGPVVKHGHHPWTVNPLRGGSLSP